MSLYKIAYRGSSLTNILDQGDAPSGKRKTTGLGKMVTWIRYSTQGGDPKDVRFHPSNPDVVYGCSAHGSVCGFSVSTRKVRNKHELYSLHVIQDMSVELTVNGEYVDNCLVKLR